MKKKKLGLFFLVIGICFIYLGYQMAPSNNNAERPVKNMVVSVSEDEAKAKLIDFAKNSIRLVEDKKVMFELGEDTTLENDKNEREKIINYETIVNELFTENGRKEFESLSFNKTPYIVKQENDYYVLKEIGEKELFLDKSISFQNLIIEKQTIRAKITFSKVEMNEEKVPTASFYTTTIRLKLIDNVWKLDSFNYNAL